VIPSSGEKQYEVLLEMTLLVEVRGLSGGGGKAAGGLTLALSGELSNGLRAFRGGEKKGVPRESGAMQG